MSSCEVSRKDLPYIRDNELYPKIRSGFLEAAVLLFGSVCFFWPPGSIIICTDPSINKQKKTRKTLISTIFLLFFTFSFSTDLYVPSNSKQQNKLRNQVYFCWHLGSHWPNKLIRMCKAVVRIRIRPKMPRIHNTGRQYRRKNSRCFQVWTSTYGIF